ncbi:hypothetical protein LTR15_003946 [Elasticomyces elasticus]|nr:hypothetical protein LTR15_003946 [Elasticomyces elasticus]
MGWEDELYTPRLSRVNAGTFINVSGNRIPRASSLEQHRHNVIDGFLSTLSGRTAAYRTEILQKPALYSWLKHQTDDDKCLTRYVYSHGWRITIQSWRESEVEQHSFRPGIRDRAQLQPPQVMRQPSQRPQFCSFAIVRSRRTSVICTTPSMAREDENLRTVVGIFIFVFYAPKLRRGEPAHTTQDVVATAGRTQHLAKPPAPWTKRGRVQGGQAALVVVGKKKQAERAEELKRLQEQKLVNSLAFLGLTTATKSQPLATAPAQWTKGMNMYYHPGRTSRTLPSNS